MNVRAAAVLLLLALTLVAACGAGGKSASEVTVFAAASLRDVVQEIGQLYGERTGSTPVYNFAGTNQLAQQILASPRADVFITANNEWMDKVEAAGLVAAGTRTPLLSNRLEVVARTDSPYRVTTPADLATLPYRQLVLADPDAVPAGEYARQWLTSEPAPNGHGTLWDAVAARVAPATDVRAAVALVESDPELIGVVYRTDATASARVHTLYEVPENRGPTITYSAAALSEGPNPEGGRSFVEFLGKPAAARIFHKYGFIPLRNG